METVIFHNEITSSAKSENVLKALARANSLNLSHEVNFNKYGTKDNIGLVAVSDVYFDCYRYRVKL